MAAVVLAVMLALAALGLMFALQTQGERRAHDWLKPKPESVMVPFLMRFLLGVYLLGLVYLVVRTLRRRPAAEAEPSPAKSWPFSPPLVAAAGLLLVVLVIKTTPGSRSPEDPPPEQRLVERVAPAELKGLGYLPDDTRLIAGIHVAEGLTEEAGSGKNFLSRLMPLLPGLKAAGEWAGWQPTDLDHVVLGVGGKEPASALLTVVVRGRKPYNPESLSQALSAGRMKDRDGRVVYRVSVDGRRGLLWCAGEKTLVLVFRLSGSEPAGLGEVPATPRTGADRIPRAMRALFQERQLGSGTSLWLAGSFREGKPLREWCRGLPELKGREELLAPVQDFLIGLQSENPFTLVAGFRAANEQEAGQLDQVFQRLQVSGLNVERVARQPGLPWVSLKAGVDGEAVLRALGRVRGERQE